MSAPVHYWSLAILFVLVIRRKNEVGQTLIQDPALYIIDLILDSSRPCFESLGLLPSWSP